MHITKRWVIQHEDREDVLRNICEVQLYCEVDQETTDDAVREANTNLHDDGLSGFRSTWKTLKNDSSFSSHGNIMEF